MRARSLLALVVPAALACGCIASSRLDANDRAVKSGKEDLAQLAWRPVTAADLPGLWRTRSIEGAAAAVLLDLSYWIDPEGNFSGAALYAGPPAQYQVLSGAWTLAGDGTLQLGEDAAPAKAEVAEGFLRLRGDEGELVLERVVEH